MEAYKIFILFSSLHVITVTSSDEKNENRCPGVFFRNDNYYNVKIVGEGVTDLRGLAALKNNFNEIYFTYTYLDKNITSKTGYLTVNDGRLHILDVVNNSNTNYADNTEGVLYIGARDGLYKYKPGAKSAERLNIKDNVVSVCIANQTVYYLNSNHELFVYQNGVSNKVSGLESMLMKQIMVGKNNKLLFLTDNNTVGIGTVYVKDFSYYGTASYMNMNGTALGKDNNETLYVCGEDALYEFDISKGDFTKVSPLPKLQGIVFGPENSPVYAKNGVIVKLIRNEVPCFD